jgi:dTDP-4-dehydrorhamnose reductase
MRVLVTGAEGMLGRDLVEILSGRFEVAGIDIGDADITRPDEIRNAIRERDPGFIVHGAAYTDVDGCEADTDTAYRVNAVGTRNVVRCAAELDVPILYVSTDFVFRGDRVAPYREYDPTGPISEYGYSKLAGEFFVRHLHRKFYIVRTAWLYGRHGKNFVDTILCAARENGALRVVDDQVGSPTYTRDLAAKIEELIGAVAGYGIYHVTNGGSCSWYDFAGKILDVAGMDDVTLEPISTAESGRAAARPAHSVLENRALRLEGIKPLRPWEEALAEYLRDADLERNG